MVAGGSGLLTIVKGGMIVVSGTRSSGIMMLGRPLATNSWGINAA